VVGEIGGLEIPGLAGPEPKEPKLWPTSWPNAEKRTGPTAAAATETADVVTVGAEPWRPAVGQGAGAVAAGALGWVEMVKGAFGEVGTDTPTVTGGTETTGGMETTVGKVGSTDRTGETTGGRAGGTKPGRMVETGAITVPTGAVTRATTGATGAVTRATTGATGAVTLATNGATGAVTRATTGATGAVTRATNGATGAVTRATTGEICAVR
jgi:hypothetical protein